MRAAALFPVPVYIKRAAGFSRTAQNGLAARRRSRGGPANRMRSGWERSRRKISFAAAPWARGRLSAGPFRLGRMYQ